MPALTPDTIPVAEPTVAMAGLLLAQVPPDEASNSEVKDPVQTEVLPVMGNTRLVTVNDTEEEQVEGAVYLIVVVPVVTPVTRPAVLTEATAGLLLLHVPPVEVSLSVTDEPAQTPLGPTIGPGAGNMEKVTAESILLEQVVVVLVPIAV